MHTLKIFPSIFISLLLSCFGAFCQNHKSNILLLNSYHKGFEWTDDITHGIEDALSETNTDLHVEYMDTKRQFDTTYQGLMLNLLEYKHKKHQYKAIITSDNNAFNFIQNYRDSLFGAVPVVFTGLNYVTKNELEGFTNVTGINEKANIKDNISLIKKLHPKCDTIKIIVDNTTTGQRLQKQVLALKNKIELDISVILIYDVTVEQLIHQLRNEWEGNIILFTLFFRDKENRFIEYDDGAKLVCENATVPVYGTWTFSMGYGIVGGYLTNGYDQGLLAGKKAMQILKGKNADDIPVEMNPPSIIMFDYNALSKHHIDERNLPKESIVKYKPPSFIERNKNFLIYLSVIIVFLSVLILILLNAIRKIDNARKANLNSKAQLRTIIDSIPSLVFINNIQGKFLLANKAVNNLSNPPLDNVEGKYISDVLPSEHITERIHEQNSNVLKFPNNIHVYENVYEINQKEIWFRTVKTACDQNLFGEPAILGVSVDITQIKETEAALQQAKNFAENLLETANTLIIGLDKEANITTFNRFAEELTGYTKHEVLGKNWFNKFIPSTNKNEIPTVFEKVLKEMPDVSQFENQIKLKYGDLRLINWNNSLIKNENGEIAGVLSIGIDVTERNKAENEIRKSENKFKSIFENSPLGIMYYDKIGVILDCNETFVKIIGSSKDKLIGLNMLEQLPDKKVVNEVKNSLKEGLGIYEDIYESITATKVTPVKGTFKGIKDSAGNITGGIGIIEDITHQKNAEIEILAANEQLQATNDELVATAKALQKSNEELSEALKIARKSKELELANKLLTEQKEELNLTINKLKETQSQLIQAEKLASIGMLTSGIAHEINNPLNFIQGGKTAIELHLFDNMPEHKKDFAPFIEMIDTGIQRASNIVQSLSHFNRKTDSYNEVLFLHKIIDNCLTMLENKLKYKVEIHKIYTKDNFKLKGNEGKMHQVFLNVLSNAEQAISKSGSITIFTELVHKHISIKITDNGCGIPEEDLQKIGEPFFTTKNAGEGTGLGLSITKNIIKEHNGSFKIDSELNKGTSVTIKLPVNK